MKKSLLLSAAALCTLGMMAQTNYAPTNWRFDNMAPGSAEGIFLRQLASGAWNCPAPFTAYDGNGGVAIATGGAGVSSGNYASMTDEEKAYLEDFYNSASIVTTTFTEADETSYNENILCLIGKDATATYGTGTARTNSFPNPALFFISGNEDSGTPMTVGFNYRLTIDYRVITPDASTSGNIEVSIADNSYNGIDKGTEFETGDGYRKGNMPIVGTYSGNWLRGVFDFTVLDNAAPDYRELPLAVKCYVAGGLMDNCIFLFRTIKLERIDEIDMNNVPVGLGAATYTDTPTSSVESVISGEKAIVTAANGAITVIDADAAIEVYNLSGAMVKKIAAPATVETIDMEGANGVYVVKVGGTAKTVIL